MEYIPIGVSILSLIVSAIVGFSTIKSRNSSDTKQETTQLTTLIVKLENINDGVNEIKADMRNMKDDVRELRDRVIKVEESTKSAHRRLDDYFENIEHGGKS
jgi:peptidoglycan hydrolase CwlO-like protein